MSSELIKPFNSLIYYARIAVFFSFVALFTACSGSGVDFKVGNWGPQVMVLGDIPNKQPDGNLGLWIQVTGEQMIGEVKVLFDGQPFTGSVSEKLITAGVPPAQLTQPGKKLIVIKQVLTGKSFSVGTFIIRSGR